MVVSCPFLLPVFPAYLRLLCASLGETPTSSLWPENVIVKSTESDVRVRTAEILAAEERIRLGGGPEAIERQHA